MNGRRAAQVAALVAFVAVDVGLVMRAASHQDAGRAPSIAHSAPTNLPTSVTLTTGSSPTTAVAGSDTVGVLSVVNATTAWRATTAACTGAPSRLSITTNGGGSWFTVVAGPPWQVISAITPTSPSAATVTGSGADCVVATRHTADGGTTWESGLGQSAGWLVNQPDSGAVQANALASHPCGSQAVLRLSPISDTVAAVLCPTGQVLRTTNGGRTWAHSGQVTGAVALAATGSASHLQVVVAADVDPCKGGLVMVRLDGSTPHGTPVACVRPGTDGPAVGAVLASPPGQPNVVWLVIGPHTWRSLNGMQTWTRMG